MSGEEDNDMHEMPGADLIHLLTRMVEALEARGQVQPSQVLVSHGRKVPVFRDSPKASSDPSIEDWITDLERHIASRNLTGLAATAFVVEHLSGKARQEILGRGLAKDTPEHIFKVLKTIFGDGLTLGQLRSRFFSYTQKSGDDVITCSLELVSLMDRIIKLDPSAKATRNAVLRERLAEAVTDTSMQQEFRRLLDEEPAMDFFEARDRVLRWRGPSQAKTTPRKVAAEASVQQLSTERDELAAAMKEMTRQMTELITLTKAQQTRRARRDNSNIRCFKCDKLGHFARQCKGTEATPATAEELNGNDLQEWAMLQVHQSTMAQSYSGLLGSALRPLSTLALLKCAAW